MVGISFRRKTLWQYSHSASILFAVLLFTAGFLCTLLWTNNLILTEASFQDPAFLQFSPAVSTFNLTYQVAIFGTAWNTIVFATLLILERDDLPIPTVRLRYEIEKAAHIVAITGNFIYSVACIALMATLARLASDASSTPNPDAANQKNAKDIAGDANARRAGQGTTAAFAAFAAAVAVCVCAMDILHMQNSRHRRHVKSVASEHREPLSPRSDNGDASKHA